MKIYYTTSVGTDEEQKNAKLSLGGFRSSSVVPNLRIGNLFGDISEYTIQIDRDQYIALMIRNETEADITNLKLHFEYPIDDEDNNISDTLFKIGAVEPGDVDGEEYIERLQDFYSAPYSVDFHEADGIANQVLLGDLANNTSFGLFFCRSLKKDKILEDYQNMIEKDEPDNSNIYRQNELPTKDEIKIVLNWD
jgi:hypothetical protein